MPARRTASPSPPRRAPPPPDFPDHAAPGPSDADTRTPAAARLDARLDARRAHVVDRAAEYVRLAELGLSAAAIARRRRKSKGHVSILLRLGRALAELPADERAALRHPRITWRLVQGLVRVDTDPASLRRQLRAALGGFSTHTVDGRQRRARRALEADPPRVAAAAPGVAWGWDAAWFARDPAGYAAAHLAHLTHVHRIVAARAGQAVRGRVAAGVAARVDAGQSLRGLQRRLTQLAAGADRATAEAGPSAVEREALATLAAVGRALEGVGRAVRVPPPPDHSRDDVAEDLGDG